MPVQSVAVLLRPDADRPVLSGRFQRRLPGGQVYLDFRYRVVRVWQQPVQTLLAGRLTTLPLAPLAAGAEAALPDVVRRMAERVSAETPSDVAAQLWMSTYLLMGLRYPEETVADLLRGVRAMHESSTYQAILAEGRAEGRATEAREVLLRLGTKRFGPPDRRTRAALRRLTGLRRLEQLTDRLLDVESWDALLEEPSG